MFPPRRCILTEKRFKVSTNSPVIKYFDLILNNMSAPNISSLLFEWVHVFFSVSILRIFPFVLSLKLLQVFYCFATAFCFPRWAFLMIKAHSFVKCHHSSLFVFTRTYQCAFVIILSVYSLTLLFLRLIILWTFRVIVFETIFVIYSTYATKPSILLNIS